MTVSEISASQRHDWLKYLDTQAQHDGDGALGPSSGNFVQLMLIGSMPHQKGEVLYYADNSGYVSKTVGLLQNL